MTDSHSGPEVDNDDVVPVETDPHDSGSTDSQGEEVKLADKDMWEGLEKKAKEGTKLAKETGVEAWTKKTLQTQLVDKAMAIDDEMNKEGTEANKLRFVWEEALTPEGRADFLKGNGWVSKMLTAAKTNLLPTFAIAQEALHFFKRKTFEAKNLAITDFKPEVIQMYCSLGLLSCSEEEARAIDGMAAEGLKVGAKAAKVLKWASLVIPGAEELEPVMAGAEKGASFLSKPAEWAAKLMPEVRAEVARRRAEVKVVEETEHHAVAKDLQGIQPPVVVDTASTSTEALDTRGEA